MIEINQLLFVATQPGVAQPHRYAQARCHGLSRAAFHLRPLTEHARAR
jgi:hypothetical protein